MKQIVAGIAAALLALCACAAQAQMPSYGASINLDQAKKVLAAAQAEARKRGWPMAIAVVDNAGMLVAYERLDDTQTASVDVAVDKGRTAAIWRRPTKVFEDAITGGGAGLRLLTIHSILGAEGGVPIVVGGKVIGGIGVSGMAADQDGVIAKVGAEALK